MPKYLAAILIPLTMAWKLAVSPEDIQELQSELFDFLSHQGFSVTIGEQTIDGMPVLRANAGECSMLVAKVSSVGSNRDMIRGLSKPGDQRFILFKNHIYTEQPTTFTAIAYLWSKALRELGLMRHIVPVFAVVASANCHATELPWDQLRKIEHNGA
jgi:hypothetical protein